MTENFKEAQLSLIKYINEDAEELMSEIQIDEETGKAYHLNWEEAFDHTTEDYLDKISGWQDDYDLTYEETRQLENWIRELRADTFQRWLDKLEQARKEAQLDKVMEIAFGC